MASLRARLLAALLALTAVGLLLLGGITYLEQRSFELDRVDDAGAHRRARGASARSRRRGSAAATRRGGGRRPGGAPRSGGGRRRRAPAAGSRRAPTASVRDAAGQGARLPRLRLSTRTITADPALPGDMPLGRAFTVHGKNGDDDAATACTPSAIAVG